MCVCVCVQQHSTDTFVRPPPAPHHNVHNRVDDDDDDDKASIEQQPLYAPSARMHRTVICMFTMELLHTRPHALALRAKCAFRHLPPTTPSGRATAAPTARKTFRAFHETSFTQITHRHMRAHWARYAAQQHEKTHPPFMLLTGLNRVAAGRVRSLMTVSVCLCIFLFGFPLPFVRFVCVRLSRRCLCVSRTGRRYVASRHAFDSEIKNCTAPHTCFFFQQPTLH